MNYKKGILSVILWFIYALTAGTVLVGTTMVMLLPEGGSRPIGLVIAGVWLAMTGLVVFLLHRFLWVKWAQNGEGSGQVKLIIEGLAVVALIAVGITLRVRESMQYDISGAAGNIWFDAVKVTETTRIPQVVHGAVYFYLQVLHGLLVFLGNKMTAALVLQIVLQILTGIFLYFAVRKLTGMVAAVVSLAYWMLCPVLSGAVILGPEPLYQLLWMIGLCVCVEALDSFRGRGRHPRYPFRGWIFLKRYCYRNFGLPGCRRTALAARSVFCIFSGDKATGKMDAQNLCRSIGIIWYSGGIFCLHRSGCRGQRKEDGKYTSGMVESLFPGKIHMDRPL